MHGAALVDGWASFSSDRAATWERRLIRALPDRSRMHSKEYLHGADFEEVVGLAKRIVERDGGTTAG